MNIKYKYSFFLYTIILLVLIYMLGACQKVPKNESSSSSQLNSLLNQQTSLDELQKIPKEIIPGCITLTINPIVDILIDWDTSLWNYSKEIDVGMGNCKDVYLIQILDRNNKMKFCFYSISEAETVYTVTDEISLLNEMCVDAMQAAKNAGYKIDGWINMGVSSYVPLVWAVCHDEHGGLAVFNQDTNEFINYNEFEKGVDSYIKFSQSDTIYGGLKWKS